MEPAWLEFPSGNLCIPGKPRLVTRSQKWQSVFTGELALMGVLWPGAESSSQGVPPFSHLWGIPTDEPGQFPSEDLASPSHPNLAGGNHPSPSSLLCLQAVTRITFHSQHFSSLICLSHGVFPGTPHIPFSSPQFPPPRAF